MKHCNDLALAWEEKMQSLSLTKEVEMRVLVDAARKQTSKRGSWLWLWWIYASHDIFFGWDRFVHSCKKMLIGSRSSTHHFHSDTYTLTHPFTHIHTHTLSPQTHTTPLSSMNGFDRQTYPRAHTHTSTHTHRQTHHSHHYLRPSI